MKSLTFPPGNRSQTAVAEGGNFSMLNSTPNFSKKQLARNSGSRNIGTIVDDRLVKRASCKKHMLWNPRGWAFDRELLVLVREAGVTTVEVFDYVPHITYTA